MREVSAGGTPIIALITHTIQNLCLSLNQAKNQNAYFLTLFFLLLNVKYH